MKKIAFVTGSRADYGIMRRYLDLLNGDSDIDLRILVTGALLDDKFGHQVELIYRDGFKIDAEVKTVIDSSTNKSIINNMADTMSKFGIFFNDYKYDLLIVLGDRYEIFATVIAAAMQRIPILHIHGGEATFGNYDEFIRHAITKMSVYHFTATEEYKNRVIQLGENPQNVFCLGALGAENCTFIDERNVPDYLKELKKKSYFVVLFHPETLTNVSNDIQVGALLDAIDAYKQYSFIFLGTNADTDSDIIRNKVLSYVDKNNNALYFENLHTDAYHYLLKNGIGLIGNSSSGIIEAPSLGVFTLNIGNRQAGRVRGNSVIDVACNIKSIQDGINRLLENVNCVEPVNPYYKEKSAFLYYSQTKELLERLNDDIKKPKEFYDIH